MKLELKDHQDRGVQVTVSDDKQRLTLSGPDGVVCLTSFHVEKLIAAMGGLLKGMVSVPAVPNPDKVAPRKGKLP